MKYSGMKFSLYWLSPNKEQFILFQGEWSGSLNFLFSKSPQAETLIRSELIRIAPISYINWVPTSSETADWDRFLYLPLRFIISPMYIASKNHLSTNGIYFWNGLSEV